MTSALTLVATPTPPPAVADDALEAQVALIACGARPGKVQACESHARKGPGLLRIASTGAADAVAAAICGSLRNGACDECMAKAKAILAAVTGVAA